MQKYKAIVIGTSAGGVRALKFLVGQLPKDLPCPIFIVLHTSPDTPSMLPQILSKVGKLIATHPIDGDRFYPSRIYIAPPNHHMMIESETIGVTMGPKENKSRPAIQR